MALTLRQEKGTKLTIPEMDDNLTFLNQKAGDAALAYTDFIRPDEEDNRRPESFDGEEWKGLAYKDEIPTSIAAYTVAEELPETIAAGDQVLYNGVMFRGALEGEEGLDAGTPIPVDGVITPEIYGAIGDGTTQSVDAINQAIAENPGKVVMVGKSRNDVYLIDKSIKIPTGTRLYIRGTLLVDAGVIRPVLADVEENATSMQVEDAGLYYRAGQKLCLTSDDMPMDGGGAWKVRRVGKVIEIASIVGDTINFVNPIENILGPGDFSVSQNARVGLMNNAILSEPGATDVRICASGIIEGDGLNHIQAVGAYANLLLEDFAAGCGITMHSSKDWYIDIEIHNMAMHGIVTNHPEAIGVSGGFTERFYFGNLKLRGCGGKHLAGISFMNSGGDTIEVTDGWQEGEVGLYSGCVNININNIYTKNNRRYGVTLTGIENRNINISNIVCDSDDDNVAVSDIYIQNAQKGANISNVLIKGNGLGAKFGVSQSEGVNISNVVITDCVNAGNTTLASISNSNNTKIVNLTIQDCEIFNGSSNGFINIDGNNNTFSGFTVKNVVGGRVIAAQAANQSIIFQDGVFENCPPLLTSLAAQADIRFSNVKGQYKFENSGQSTIPAGQTKVAVSHGLSYVPKLDQLTVIPIFAEGVNYSISDVQLGGFYINLDAALAEDIVFSWKVEGYKGSRAGVQGVAINYDSDFSSGVDGVTGARMTLTANTDGVEGENDWLKVVPTADSGQHYIQINGSVVAGNLTRIRFKYYIPAANTIIKHLQVQSPLFFTPVLAYLSDLGEVREYISTPFVATGTNMMVMALNAAYGSNFVGTGDENDDVFYIKDIFVETINV